MSAVRAGAAAVGSHLARSSAGPARALRVIGLLVAGLAGACDDGCCLLKLVPDARGMALVGGDWNDSLVDSDGLADLEIEVGGRMFFSEDFLAVRDRELSVKVGRTGRVAVFARLVHRGSVVAGGFMSWPLDPETSWTLRIARGPDTPLHCGWCVGSQSIPIPEAAARYTGEVLWLARWAWPHDPDPDIIYNSPTSPP